MLYSPGRMNLVLRVYSLASRFVSGLKNLLYDRGILKPEIAPLPVISVGNLSLGGTGKTPLAIEVIAWLAARGRRPALVSRGYLGRWEKKGGMISDGTRITGTWRDGGDEPFMAAGVLPGAGVFVGKNRLASAVRARQMGFDVAVLDDGFQHRRIGRNLDIVLYSPSAKAALRESAAGLRRAGVILVEKTELREAGDVGLPPGSPEPLTYEVEAHGIHRAGSQDSIAVEELRDRPVLAFCGIAGPERFMRLLGSQGIKPVSFLAFPDHHAYPQESVEKILRAARAAGAAEAVTTAKDAVKLANGSGPFPDLPIYVLEIRLAIEPRFFERLEEALRTFSQVNA
jgi:tetraacyldisaccharide 4'-kinase